MYINMETMRFIILTYITMASTPEICTWDYAVNIVQALHCNIGHKESVLDKKIHSLAHALKLRLSNHRKFEFDLFKDVIDKEGRDAHMMLLKLKLYVFSKERLFLNHH